MFKKSISIMLITVLTLILSVPSLGQGNYNLSFKLNKDSYELDRYIEGTGIVKLEEKGVSGAEVTLVVEDEAAKSVYEVGQYTTDANGKFNVNFKMPKNVPEGDYVVKVKAFEVEEKATFSLSKATVIKPSDDGGSSGNGSDDSSNKNEEENIVKETISTKGSTVKDKDGNVELVFEKGTFDKKAEVEVKVLEEKEITKPKASEKIVRVADVYEFTSSIETFNKPVKVTLKYNKSKLEDISEELLGIYTLNKKSNRWEYIGGKVGKKSGTISVELKHFGKYTVMVSTKTFTDITNHWAKHPIEVMAARQIVNGKDEINFAPEAKITRAEFAKTIVNAIGLEKEAYKETFSDVSDSKWYTGYVESAANAGIVLGADGKFNPNKEITRQEMAVMIVRALNLVDSSKMTTSELGFNDNSDIANWATESVSIAVNNGIIKGKTKTIFAPIDNAKRAEAAQMVYNLLKALDRI